MKINKDGEIKLSKGEHKVGNFIIKDEENHFKVFTANAPIRLPMWSIRYRKDMVVARFIQTCLDNNDEDYIRLLHNWLVVIYNTTGIVPEYEYLKEVNDAAEKSLHNHPELYGIRSEQLSEEENNAIIEYEKEKTEFISNVGDGNELQTD